MTRKRAFTLIELLVVIAIIAILAAILFPVFARAKEAAVKTKAVAQMRQLSMSMFMYATDYDDFMVPASTRTPGNEFILWPVMVMPYVKNEEIFVAPGTVGRVSLTWEERGTQSIGYNESTRFDTEIPLFNTAVNFSVADDSSRIGLIAVTPNDYQGSGKERGYTFSPYNGPDHPTNPRLGLPLIADYNICADSPLAPNQLKPIYARYGADGEGNGQTPVVFADGHVKSYSANRLNNFGEVIWRFRERDNFTQ